MRKYWNIFWRLRIMHLMLLFQYRADFLFWTFVSIMWTLFHYFSAYLLVSSAGQIGGWKENEMFVLMSVYTIFDAFTWSFFYFNMRRYSERVFSGELDAYLLKPIDTQFMLSIEHNSYNNVPRLIIGIVVLIKSLFNLNTLPNTFQVLAGIGVMVIGFFTLYSLWFFLSTFSFWVDRINNINDIIPSVRRLAQFPRDVYSGVFSFIFCVIFPFVLITTQPAEIFIGKISIQWLTYFLAFTIFSIVLCRFFFHFSLRKYSGAGG